MVSREEMEAMLLERDSRWRQAPLSYADLLGVLELAGVFGTTRDWEIEELTRERDHALAQRDEARADANRAADRHAETLRKLGQVADERDRLAAGLNK